MEVVGHHLPCTVSHKSHTGPHKFRMWSGAGKMELCVKCLLRKNEDLSSDLQNPRKNVCQSAAVILAPGGGDGRIAGALWPANGRSVCFRVTERLWLTK